MSELSFVFSYDPFQSHHQHSFDLGENLSSSNRRRSRGAGEPAVFLANVTDTTAHVLKYHWDFGDGTTSTERHPIHQYQKPGENYVVILDVEGPAGKSRHSKVWDVQVR